MTDPNPDETSVWIDEIRSVLPEDGCSGALIGRAWIPPAGDARPGGPGVVAIREDGVFDLTGFVATSAELVNADDPAALARRTDGAVNIGSWREVLRNSFCERRDPARPFLLAPVDLQSVRACGVTFVASLLERVIEECIGGDPARAEAMRREISDQIGTDLSEVRPGSDAARRLKDSLIERGLWSQYLEVGIGPDVEVFTKAQPMSSVGFGAEIGVHPDSVWNNPEPEVVLVVNARGRIVGATLGNDVNLRDFEGRSALLLGRAKDNNASCAVGPFLRLIDETFSLDDIRRSEVHMTIEGPEGFKLSDTSSMAEISRDIVDLVEQTAGENHQYPDGLVLFTGTMFSPSEDRDEAGGGFTHHLGDIVKIRSPKLGMLANKVNHSNRIAPWTFGIAALMRNLSARGLI